MPTTESPDNIVPETILLLMMSIVFIDNNALLVYTYVSSSRC